VPDDTIVLSATGLEKRYGGVLALGGVDFELHSEEVVGVIGPNGSGKTTLFDVLSGATRASGGEIRWRGRSITRTAAHERARMGLARTFQQAMAFPGLSVLDNLEAACVAAEHRSDRATTWDCDGLLDYAGLSKLADTSAGDLSWGQGRILGVAMALALSPEALLLDEPFAGLSPVAVHEITTILTRLKDDGHALAIIDHELEYVLPLCDRLLVMATGLKIAEGEPAEVIAMDIVQSAYLGDLG